jgi:hypothetical protein
MKKFLFLLAIPSFFLFATSCDLIDELKDDNDIDKVAARIANEWTVESVRVIEYGFVPGSGLTFEQQNPIGRDTLLPVIKMRFFLDEGNIIKEGKVIQTSSVKGVEQVKEFRWRYDGTYLKLRYPNPNIGMVDVEVIFDIVEATDQKLHFTRYENLVSNSNGAKYGSARSTWKMQR